MTTIQSIKNDAMTVGTAAASAGLASAVINNSANAKKIITPVANKIAKNAAKTIKADTYTKAGKTIYEGAKKAFSKEAMDNVKKAFKKPFSKATMNKIKDAFEKTFSKETFESIKDKLGEINTKNIKNVASNLGETIKNSSKKFADFVTTNWKFKGAVKAAVVAGVIAAGIVAVKNLFKKDEA